MDNMRRNRWTALLLALWLPTGWAAAAEPERRPGAKVKVVAGPGYKAGPLHRFFLGSDYRRTWTTPVTVEVLDLGSYAGGLKPEKQGGGKQTISLGFEAPDGREFRFRSVDKDPSATLPEELRDTAAEWVVQDQIRASYPVGPLLVDELAQAAGVLHVKHELYVLPDDPALGEFGQHKGLLGILEENPDPDAPLPPGFEGSKQIIETLDRSGNGSARARAPPGFPIPRTATRRSRTTTGCSSRSPAPAIPSWSGSRRAIRPCAGWPGTRARWIGASCRASTVPLSARPPPSCSAPSPMT
jgi:hypothetical protein